METLDWGIVEYDTALSRQLELVEKRRQDHITNTLIFTEHPPTFTLGCRKESAKHLLWAADEVKSRGITLFQSNRGGDITYHGPGQIVGYAILDLSQKKDLHAYLRSLEEVLLKSLLSLNIQASRSPGKTGIWVKKRKLGAIGIAVKHWITYHGFALNVNNDLSPFEGIIPCGISKQEGMVSSIAQELGKECDISVLKKNIALEFWKEFT